MIGFGRLVKVWHDFFDGTNGEFGGCIQYRHGQQLGQTQQRAVEGWHDDSRRWSPISRRSYHGVANHRRSRTKTRAVFKHAHKRGCMRVGRI